MGRFGFGKKDQDEQEDSGRKALFGSRSKPKSPAPPANNPYATSAAALRPDPYTQAKINAGVAPAPQGYSAPPSNGYGGLPTGSYGGPQHGNSAGQSTTTYGAPPPSQHQNTQDLRSRNRYGANEYGDQGGYGAGGAGNNPYAKSDQNNSYSRPGGYGGLGRSKTASSEDADSNRDALFGGARERSQKQPHEGPPEYSYDIAVPQQDDRSYGAYGDRQLTAEEEEEEDVQADKQNIKVTRKQGILSMNRSITKAHQALETGTNTLARLGAQGERLYNTELNLDISAMQMQMAHDKTDELRRYRRNFLVPAHVPFTTNSRNDKAIEKAHDRHLQGQKNREEVRERAYKNQQQLASNFESFDRAKQASKTGQGLGASATFGAGGGKLANRAKFQFEADSDDDRDEETLEDQFEQLHGLSRGMNLVTRAIGDEIRQQNETIDRIGQKSDAVQSDVVRGSERLKRIN